MVGCLSVSTSAYCSQHDSIVYFRFLGTKKIAIPTFRYFLLMQSFYEINEMTINFPMWKLLRNYLLHSTSLWLFSSESFLFLFLKQGAILCFPHFIFQWKFGWFQFGVNSAVQNKYNYFNFVYHFNNLIRAVKDVINLLYVETQRQVNHGDKMNPFCQDCDLEAAVRNL